jgi:hypothetical protein
MHTIRRSCRSSENPPQPRRGGPDRFVAAVNSGHPKKSMNHAVES